MENKMKKTNIQRAQDTRRIIGVRKLLDKILEYRRDPELWKRVKETFEEAGLFLDCEWEIK